MDVRRLYGSRCERAQTSAYSGLGNLHPSLRAARLRRLVYVDCIADRARGRRIRIADFESDVDDAWHNTVRVRPLLLGCSSAVLPKAKGYCHLSLGSNTVSRLQYAHVFDNLYLRRVSGCPLFQSNSLHCLWLWVCPRTNHLRVEVVATHQHNFQRRRLAPQSRADGPGASCLFLNIARPAADLER